MSKHTMQTIAITLPQKLALITTGIILALVFSEVIIRLVSLDMRLLRKALYYQCAFLPLHKTSSNPERLYETTPGAVLKGVKEVHPKETRYRFMDVSINSLGFRNREFSAAKKKGVFRIIIFGGSNTFGATVSNADTYPAQLQNLFDKKYPGRVEVWNAGICAYVISQDVAYAQEVMAKYDPDLLIFQDTNVGRRAFLQNAATDEINRLFSKNPELYSENLPPILRRESSFMQQVHYSMAKSSALYRVLCMAFYSASGAFNSNDPTNSVTHRYRNLWHPYGQSVSNRKFEAFIGRYPNKPIALFYIDENYSENNMPNISIKDNMRVLTLDPSDKAPEYGEIHPPSYVYSWYASELFSFITTNIDIRTTE